MKINKVMKYGWLVMLSICILVSCTVSYQFNGASVNYDIIKTMSIKDFPNYADRVNPTLSRQFTDELKNRYVNQTRLQMVDAGADLEIEGEIVQYFTTEMAVIADGLASKTKLTIGVKIRYVNNKNPADDLSDQTFTAYREYSSERMFDDVEAELVRQIIEDLTDQIYNATLGNW